MAGSFPTLLWCDRRYFIAAPRQLLLCVRHHLQASVWDAGFGFGVEFGELLAGVEAGVGVLEVAHPFCSWARCCLAACIRSKVWRSIGAYLCPHISLHLYLIITCLALHRLDTRYCHISSFLSLSLSQIYFQVYPYVYIQVYKPLQIPCFAPLTGSLSLSLFYSLSHPPSVSPYLSMNFSDIQLSKSQITSPFPPDIFRF